MVIIYSDAAGSGGDVDIPESQLTRNHNFSLSFKFLVAWSTFEEDVYISDHGKSRNLAGWKFPA